MIKAMADGCNVLTCGWPLNSLGVPATVGIVSFRELDMRLTVKGRAVVKMNRNHDELQYVVLGGVAHDIMGRQTVNMPVLVSTGAYTLLVLIGSTD